MYVNVFDIHISYNSILYTHKHMYIYTYIYIHMIWSIWLQEKTSLPTKPCHQRWGSALGQLRNLPRLVRQEFHQLPAKTQRQKGSEKKMVSPSWHEKKNLGFAVVFLNVGRINNVNMCKNQNVVVFFLFGNVGRINNEIMCKMMQKCVFVFSFWEWWKDKSCKPVQKSRCVCFFFFLSFWKDENVCKKNENHPIFFLKSKSPPSWGHLLIASCDEYFAHFLGSMEIGGNPRYKWHVSAIVIGKEPVFWGAAISAWWKWNLYQKKLRLHYLHHFILQLAVAQVQHLYPQSATFEHYDNSTISPKTLQFYSSTYPDFILPTKKVPSFRRCGSNVTIAQVPGFMLLHLNLCATLLTHLPSIARHMRWNHQTPASVAKLIVCF